MHVRVIPFGVLKDWLGSAGRHRGAAGWRHSGRAAGAPASHVAGTAPRQSVLRGIAVSVNAEYAQAAHILHDGDEVGLLPPVSGGGPARTANALDESREDESILVALTRERIDAEKMVAAAKSGEDGAVVVFDGIVRNHSRGRRTFTWTTKPMKRWPSSRCGSWA